MSVPHKEIPVWQEHEMTKKDVRLDEILVLFIHLLSRGWNVTYDIKPPYQAPHIRHPISSPPYQTPHIKPPIASPLQYQDPISGHLFQYETVDLPYQAPTYDIKPFELNRQYEIADQLYRTSTYDIKSLVLDFRNEALAYGIEPIG